MFATSAEAEIRPLRGEDAAAYIRFAHRLAPEDVRLRFGRIVRWSDDCARRLLDDGVAYAAFDCRGEVLGVARLVEGEVALMVRSDLKRHGIGRALLARLVDHAMAAGMTELSGHFLAENRPALALAHRAGFRLEGNFGSLVELRLCLP
jgi:acetyltransferase